MSASFCVTVEARIGRLYLLAESCGSRRRREIRSWHKMPFAEYIRLLFCWIGPDLRKIMKAERRDRRLSFSESQSTHWEGLWCCRGLYTPAHSKRVIYRRSSSLHRHLLRLCFQDIATLDDLKALSTPGSTCACEAFNWAGRNGRFVTSSPSLRFSSPTHYLLDINLL